MNHRRLYSWLEESSVLPDIGRIGVFNAWPDLELPGVAPDRIYAVQPMAMKNAALESRGLKTARIVDNHYDAVIINLPREKARALSYLKDAVRRVPTAAPIVIDGQKTDGIESILKFCRARFDVREIISKAHGKLFWFLRRELEQDDLSVLELPEPEPVLQPFGFHTAPGVFSADAPDRGSVLLGDNLPLLSGRVADLGAGWGYLSCRVLEKGRPDELHLVEADWLAVLCAQKNVVSETASIHWGDVLTWQPKAPVDHIVTNPPFHTGRSADPGLGRAFIDAAAGMLTPRGSLWLVANRHLPYESALEDAFRDVQSLTENPSFKIFHATSPKRSRKG